MKQASIRAFAALAATASLVSPASAQCSRQRLLASNPSPAAWFGFDVSIDGTLAVAGAYYANGNSPNSGAAYVYQLIGESWTLTQILTSATTDSDDGFGVSVALSEKRVAVGSYLDATSSDLSGVAFVFDKDTNGWVQTARLTASDPAPGMEFGVKLALEGDRLVIGAPGYGTSGVPGAAYVFERLSGAWTEIARLQASDATAGDLFGAEVELSGDRILVGAPSAQFDGGATGAAYVFDRIGGDWTETAILRSSDAGIGDGFGTEADVESKRILVGAPSHDEGQVSNSGSAYLFEEMDGNWVQVREFFQPPPAQTAAAFGIGGALRGDLAIIGATRRDQMTDIDRGAAYVYRRMTEGAWILTDELLPTNNRALFGGDIEISGDNAFISAHGEGGQNRGACYAVRLGGDFASYCVAIPNSTGVGCTIGSTGSPSIAANDFTLTAAGAPAHRWGQFAYGNQTAQLPFGNGQQCIGGQRFVLDPPVQSDAAGNVTLHLDFTAPPLSSGAGAVLAGKTWYFQLAYLDPAAGGEGFNLSDGLCATFCP